MGMFSRIFTSLYCVCLNVSENAVLSNAVDNSGQSFSLYDELLESLNSVFLLSIVLLMSIGILLYIFLRNRTKKIKEIVGEERYNKLFKFKKIKSNYQKLISANGSGTLFLIKINNFEFLSELYGSNLIEDFLIKISEKISNDLRPEYYYGRISLGEFIVYTAEKKSKKDVAEYAFEIMNNLKTPVIIKDSSINTSFSMGIATMESSRPFHNELFRRATIAMWYSKRQGENEYSIYSTEIDEKFIKEDEIKKELTRALNNNEFELYYQPIFNSGNGSVYGIEALIRWHHPDKGILKPDYFIVEAERNSMIVDIGYWVIERAFKDFNKILNSFGSGEIDDLRLSINVSPIQLEDRKFLENLRNYIVKYNMKAENVVLEITEQVYIQETLRVNELLRSIKKIGCKIAFDDFGIQYSTLSKLNDLNFDVVKIDRKFILGIPNDLVCIEIIKMLVSLTNITRKQLVAEGVDSASQIERLREYGCETIQGFYYSQAIDVVSLINTIHESIENKQEVIPANFDSSKKSRDESMGIVPLENTVDIVFEQFFKEFPLPVTINMLIESGDSNYDIVLKKINDSYKEEFCVSGELVEGKTSEKVYPNLNNIRKERIAEAIRENKNIRFPMYYSRQLGKVHDLSVIPLGGNNFAFAYFGETENSEALYNLRKYKNLFEESNDTMETVLALGESDVWEYDIEKRTVQIRWHGNRDSKAESQIAVEDYFEMIHPDDRKNFREEFLSFILNSTNHKYDRNNMFESEYRIRAPWKEKWSWIRTNFCIKEYEGKVPKSGTAVNSSIEKYKEYEKEIHYSLNHDAITGLLNRKGINEELEKAIGSWKSYAMGIMDLDDFRRINESGGHDHGNSMIREVASRISTSLPEGAVAGRLSGDEFLVCFEYTTEARLNSSCRRILRSVNFKDKFGNEVSASMGVSVCPQHAGNCSGLMAIADKELEKVKESKKGSYSVYSEN